MTGFIDWVALGGWKLLLLVGGAAILCFVVPPKEPRP